MNIKLKIDNYDDRQMIIRALANSGYKVSSRQIQPNLYALSAEYLIEFEDNDMTPPEIAGTRTVQRSDIENKLPDLEKVISEIKDGCSELNEHSLAIDIDQLEYVLRSYFN